MSPVYEIRCVAWTIDDRLCSGEKCHEPFMSPRTLTGFYSLRRNCPRFMFQGMKGMTLLYFRGKPEVMLKLVA